MAPKIPFVGKRHMPIAFLLSASAPSHRERPVSRDASSLLAPQPFPRVLALLPGTPVL